MRHWTFDHLACRFATVPVTAAVIEDGKVLTDQRIGVVYLVKGTDGAVEQIVLPVYGKGLWSTLYGFLALKADPAANFPVTGITFYEHAETPGLGGEVDNPKWKAQWPGKTVYDENGAVVAGLKKGGIDPEDPFDKAHLVDALAGATITSNGVTDLIHYWLGDEGFGPFIAKLKAQEV